MKKSIGRLSGRWKTKEENDAADWFTAQRGGQVWPPGVGVTKCDQIAARFFWRDVPDAAARSRFNDSAPRVAWRSIRQAPENLDRNDEEFGGKLTIWDAFLGFRLTSGSFWLAVEDTKWTNECRSIDATCATNGFVWHRLCYEPVNSLGNFWLSDSQIWRLCWPIFDQVPLRVGWADSSNLRENPLAESKMNEKMKARRPTTTTSPLLCKWPWIGRRFSSTDPFRLTYANECVLMKKRIEPSAWHC
jgi:hypothetical protein